ncbi:hypothetical protein [Myxococcus eversor]|uniref:hypothetical protein n=1 Tax=Myxococcus eversor TaxID=2709661 RepID=UPI0013D4F994|nr:hypothetical protein [Myxococcus eversor]
MRTFTRWMTVVAVAAALTMTGCRERSREDNSGAMGGSGNNKDALQHQGTGGSGQPQMQGTDAGTMR